MGFSKEQVEGTAAVERVRAALAAEVAWHEHLKESGESVPRHAIGIGVIERALEGAPELEWEYRVEGDYYTYASLEALREDWTSPTVKILRKPKMPWTPLPVEEEKK